MSECAPACRSLPLDISRYILPPDNGVESVEHGIHTFSHLMSIDNRVKIREILTVTSLCKNGSICCLCPLPGMCQIIIIILKVLANRIIYRCTVNLDPGVNIRIFFLKCRKINGISGFACISVPPSFPLLKASPFLLPVFLHHHMTALSLLPYCNTRSDIPHSKPPREVILRR